MRGFVSLFQFLPDVYTLFYALSRSDIPLCMFLFSAWVVLGMGHGTCWLWSHRDILC